MNNDNITTSFSTSSTPIFPDLTRLHAREGFIRQSIYEWPAFEFPGYRKAPSPKFKNELELIQYLQARAVEIGSPPLHSALAFGQNEERRIAATIADIADDLVYGLECLAKHGNATAAEGLHEIAEKSNVSVGRELSRGNAWLANKIKHVLRWPSFASSNSSFRKTVESNLQDHRFGEAVPNKVTRAGIADPAHQLVDALFKYMFDTRKKIEVIEKEISLDAVDQSKVSPFLLLLRTLPLQLTEENYEQWHRLAMKIMEITAGNDNFWSHHPAFKNEPLKALIPGTGDGANMTRALKAAWLKRAGQV
jgi:hypothetical protein